MMKSRLPKILLMLMISCLLTSSAIINESFYIYNQNQEIIKYKFGAYLIDKEHYIYNIRTNVQSYLEFKRSEGWCYGQVSEFRNAYERYMKAFDDPNNPYRFYTTDFGELMDTKGELSDADIETYWYDNKGNRISNYEYSKLKESKKKNYRTFHANQAVAAYFLRIGNAIVEDEKKRSIDDF